MGRNAKSCPFAREDWQMPQSKLIKDWKGFTARSINRVLGRHGQLWQQDYWDRYIRDEKHYRKVRDYIEWNPVKAGLGKMAGAVALQQRAFSQRIQSAPITAKWRMT